MSAFSGRAADLPAGSVVANQHAALFKDAERYVVEPWAGTDRNRYSDNEVDLLLGNGAQVLRVGDGR